MKPLRPAVILLTLAATAAAAYLADSPGEAMTTAASGWIETLTPAQRTKAVMPFDTPRRADWHFVPMETRKGLPLSEMTEDQRQAAHSLLSAALSDAGYDKTTGIMNLENLLRALEGEGRRWPRDSGLYYWTVFGEPAASGRWGLSVEGHHLSLNFVVQDGRVVSSTPQFLGANPATVQTAGAGVAVGTRVLRDEEQLAFDLLASLDEPRRVKAVIAEQAPPELRGPVGAQPPTEPAVGLSAAEMTADQRMTLRRLIKAYAGTMPGPVAEARLGAIETAGFDGVRFAWLGADRPGVGHGYRVQGPTFLIEFVNTQPDAEGNPANHIHSVWRDTTGDFGLRVASE